jgi:hypothetical protein
VARGEGYFSNSSAQPCKRELSAEVYSVSFLGEMHLIGLTPGFYGYLYTSLDAKTL